MALVETLEGDLAGLALFQEAWNQFRKLRCHLFVNDYSPTPLSVAADFEAPGAPGYASRAVKYWTPPQLDLDGGYIAADPVVFSFGAFAPNQTLYGYWMEDTSTPDRVWFAERFAEPVPIDPAGDSFVFFPTYRISSPPVP